MKIIFFISLHFLTSITFPLNLYGIEHAPWYLLRIVSNLIVFSILSFVLILVVTLFSFIIFDIAIDYWVTIKYYIYFLSAFVPIIYSSKLISQIRIFSRYFFWILLFLSILQKFDLIFFLDPFFDILISRYNSNELGGYRGVSLIETEPARASYLLVMTFLIGYWGRTKVGELSLMIVVLWGIIRSVSGLALSGVALLGVIGKKTSLILILPSFLLIFILFFVYIDAFPSSKLAIVFAMLFDSGLDDSIDYIFSVSGGRLPSIYQAWSDILGNYFLPMLSYDFIYPSLIEVSIYNGYGFTNTVPGSIILYHLRVLGFLFLIIGLLYVYKRMGRHVLRFLASSGFFIFICIGILYSPPGSPLLIIFLKVVIDEYKKS
jgi:hypothetical protein